MWRYTSNFRQFINQPRFHGLPPQSQPELSDWGLPLSRFFPGQFHIPVHAYVHLHLQEYVRIFQSSLCLSGYPNLPFRFLARLLFAPNWNHSFRQLWCYQQITMAFCNALGIGLSSFKDLSSESNQITPWEWRFSRELLVWSKYCVLGMGILVINQKIQWLC